MLAPTSLFGAMALLYFACLRESPTFWLSSGGYPAWLQEYVLTGFYPLALIEFSSVFVLGFNMIRHAASSRSTRLVQAGLILCIWVFSGMALLVSLANNLNNFIEGRPLHSHSTRTDG